MEIIQARKVEQAYKNLKTRLSPKEKDVVASYYGLDGNVRHSLREIGEKYQVTRERIRQIKVVALRKIKITDLKNDLRRAKFKKSK